MLTLVLLQDLFLLYVFISMCKSNEIRLVEAVRNAVFENKRITELPTVTSKVRSKLECVIECKKSPSCLSFTFNDESKDCYMYTKDFVHVTETQTTDEAGWNYYYVVAGNELDKSTCELPTIGICQSFCFFYRNGFSSNTTQDFKQTCSVKGGEVIIVDRYLKQYCMGQAVDSVIGSDLLVLNGIQDETTGEWTHFDGTKMAYFYWDYQYTPPQPDYVSAIATPGLYTGSLVTRKLHGYRWHDAIDEWVNVVLCEIR